MDTSNLDIVYFIKDGVHNEEFRYSLRSVSDNMSYNRVWVFGGCPTNIIPDVRVRVSQSGRTKWDRVRGMFMTACQNKELTENFILFNDDFFVMKPTTRIEPLYRCVLQKHINMLEAKYFNKSSEYSKLLRKCSDELAMIGKTQLSYELHTPFIFNKNMLIELIKQFPKQHCTRTMYGNFYNIGGTQANDVKIFTIKPNFDYKNSQFLSTEDNIVNVNNDIWRYIKKQFPNKSKYED